MPTYILAQRGPNGEVLPIFTLGATQNISYNAAGGSAASNGTPFVSNTRAILICSVSSDIRIATSASPTATASTTLVPKGALVCIAVHGGWTISVLSNDTNTGSLSVTELAAAPD